MVEEFDNEIDSILRQTARGNSIFAPTNPQSNHLDADELSAFAENALPEKMRLNYVAHLADCDRCRKILSNLITLNPESQSEILLAEEPQLLTANTKIPWYRKFFTVPTLALTMGAFILFFAGIGIYTVLQNDSTSSQISQVSEKQPGGKGMSSDGDAAPPDNFSGAMSNKTTANSNMMSANTTANVSNSAVTATNSNAALTRREIEQTTKADDSQSGRKLNTGSKLAENNQSEAATMPPPAAPPPPPIAQITTENSEQSPPQTDDEDRAQSSKVLRAAPKPAPSGEAKKKEVSTETTTVSGKTFKRANNAWVDAAYRGQSTINITRGTNEYKNLDSGLRGIVENLGGTVVIVWKERAYRIQ